MAKNFYRPTRMCVACRDKHTQENLLRLRCIDGELSAFSGVGRSFYFCKVCLDDEKKIAKALMRQCRSGKKDELMSKLKEIVINE
ncbi:hypothetical protein FJR03_07845 [Sulfurimonas marina]|uniref:DUF448 domain-containing protein n=2 Tax=Sulfurimonas marina TaxID=2590551 RepID=A0A7M1B148_9BACT|nr:hypothetical protein FJR03_07845 [Sulfurimonas marina]